MKLSKKKKTNFKSYYQYFNDDNLKFLGSGGYNYDYYIHIDGKNTRLIIAYGYESQYYSINCITKLTDPYTVLAFNKVERLKLLL
jgi:hypothetical protein